MERFLLFRGSRYYPFGGWRDFGGSFSTRELAIEALAAECLQGESYEWAHVIDTAAAKPAMVWGIGHAS